MTDLELLKRRATRASVLAGATIAVASRVARKLRRPEVSTGGTDSAAYCYSVWLRHLIHAEEMAKSTLGAAVLELGPGDSLGVGYASLLTGAARYVALDAVAYRSRERDLEMFDRLVGMVQGRMPIPDERVFPEVKPLLDDYAFPARLIDERRLAGSLEPARIRRLRSEVAAGEGSSLSYLAPWGDRDVVPPASVDLIISQAVLEHVTDLEGMYHAMATWLREGGMASHQIDFRSHGTSVDWNGHWAYPDWAWRLVRGRHSAINRAPLSEHLRLAEHAGLDVIRVITTRATDGIHRSGVHPSWRWLSDDDITCAGAFVQLARPRG